MRPNQILLGGLAFASQLLSGVVAKETTQQLRQNPTQEDIPNNQNQRREDQFYYDDFYFDDYYQLNPIHDDFYNSQEDDHYYPVYDDYYYDDYYYSGKGGKGGKSGKKSKKHGKGGKGGKKSKKGQGSTDDRFQDDQFQDDFFIDDL
jgi:hypothetical protein